MRLGHWLREHKLRLLARTLREIRAAEERKDYAERNRLTYFALGECAELGIPCGVRIDPQEPEWPVAFIELTQGQVSWHLPQHPTPWDGHDTEEKYRRVEAFCKEVLGE